MNGMVPSRPVISVSVVIAASVVLASLVMTSALGETAPPSVSAKTLSCDYGLAGGGMPISPPPGYDAEFAVAIVEIHSATEIHDARVTNFILIDRAGKIGRMKHVVAVSAFDDPPYPANGIKGTGSLAYYDDLGRSHPWNGTLPQGMIRLRIRVALLDDPFDTLDDPQKCDITVGPYTIEGPVTGSWPVGLVYRIALCRHQRCIGPSRVVDSNSRWRVGASLGQRLSGANEVSR